MSANYSLSSGDGGIIVKSTKGWTKNRVAIEAYGEIRLDNDEARELVSAIERALAESERQAAKRKASAPRRGKDAG